MGFCLLLSGKLLLDLLADGIHVREYDFINSARLGDDGVP